jgi:hypothetical protein
MPDPANILFLDCIVAGLIAFDLIWVIVTGRARLWRGRRITCEQNPQQYHRYIYESIATLGLCFAAFIYAVLSSDWLRDLIMAELLWSSQGAHPHGWLIILTRACTTIA